MPRAWPTVKGAGSRGWTREAASDRSRNDSACFQTAGRWEGMVPRAAREECPSGWWGIRCESAGLRLVLLRKGRHFDSLRGTDV